MAVALFGLADNDIFDACFVIDLLHQDANGVVQHILGHLQAALAQFHTDAKNIMATINQCLKSMKSQGFPRLPKEGTEASKLSAEERNAIIKALPIAMNGIVDNKVLDLFTGECL